VNAEFNVNKSASNLYADPGRTSMQNLVLETCLLETHQPQI